GPCFMRLIGHACMSSKARGVAVLSHESAAAEIPALSLHDALPISAGPGGGRVGARWRHLRRGRGEAGRPGLAGGGLAAQLDPARDRKSTRLNSSHVKNSYAVFCLKKK